MDSRPYTGIDFGFLPLRGNQLKIHDRLHESTIDSRAYTWIDFGFLFIYENHHRIPGPWWESLNLNSHQNKESWLWNTSVMEIQCGYQSTMRNNFQENMMNMMNMMMNMMKKDTYIRCSLRLTLEQDIHHIQRTLWTIQIRCNKLNNNKIADIKPKITKSQRKIDNY